MTSQSSSELSDVAGEPVSLEHVTVSGVTVTVEPVTVFRAFEQGEFREWPSWIRVRSLLGSNGGSYGLSGPRGAGKSWLMLRAVEDARDEGAVGLWYPSPSEYDPLAFLASLTDSLAGEIERRYRRLYPLRDVVRSNVLLISLLTAVLAAGVYLVVAMWSGIETWGWGLFIQAVLVALLAGLFATLTIRFPRSLLHPSKPSEETLLREALIARERARYSATRREETELGAEAGRGFLARARTSRQRELIERPATLSSLVNDFRGLAALAGEVAGRAVIAIDELDKMDDGEKVRELLRDIKGIFEIRGVHFFVSVSDEAARSLHLGALTGRNEFNSSFYTVIELPPVTPEACAELLAERARVPRDVALALAILAGGNPREVLRLAEIAGSVTTGPDAVVKVMREEALSLRREIVASVDVEGVPAMSSRARTGAFGHLPDEPFESPVGLRELASTALDAGLWEPDWSDGGWDARFAESWHRLLLRIAVAGDLIESPAIVQDVERGLRLRDAIVVAGQSAAVARIVLERGLQVEVRQVGLESRAARQQMTRLARRYEQTRASMESGPERTEAMEAIAADGRLLARDAAYEGSDIAALIRSDAAGDRVMGLAAVEATGDPGSLEVVLEAVRSGHIPFEQYRALRALESLRPGLSEEQRVEVADQLSDPTFVKGLAADSDRDGLRKRILRGLEEEEATRREARAKQTTQRRKSADGPPSTPPRSR